MKLLGYDIKKFKEENKSIPKPKLKPQGVIQTPWNRDARKQPINPDDVFQKKNSFEIYDEMLKDYQIKSLMDIRKKLILGSEWRIEPPKDEDGEPLEEFAEITEFVEHTLRDGLKGSLKDYLYEILSAMDYGFSVQEIIYIERDGKIVIDKFKQIPPDSIEFNVDDFGNLEPGGLKQFISEGTQSLDPRKFIILTWNPKNGNLYGTSDLRACHTPWFIKDKIMKYWPMFLEKFGSPFLLAKYDTETIDTGEADTILDILNGFQQSSVAVVPMDVELEIKEISKQGGEGYEQAINRFDQQIAAALLVPNLLNFAQTIEGGSFALGKTQLDILITIVETHRQILEENVVNEQIIKPLVNFNFANITEYPKLVFGPLMEGEKVEKVKTYIELIKTGKVRPNESDVNHIRETLGFPMGDVEIIDTSLDEEKQQVGDEDEASDEEKESVKDIKKKPKELNQKIDMAFASRENMVFVDDVVNFRKIDSEFKEGTEKAIGRISTIVERFKIDFINEVKQRQILEKEKLSSINNFKIPITGSVRTQFERLLNAMALNGLRDSNSEIKTQTPERFAIIDNPDLDLKASKAFLRAFSKTKAIQLAGDMSSTIERQVRIILVDGFKNGLTTKDIISDLEIVFSPYIRGTVIPQAAINPHILETIVRTNANTFYNQGRLSSFNQAAKTGIVTHYQFSAIMDNRTSDICEELHGTVTAVGDGETTSTINPPRHFSCRSILVPITKFRQKDMQRKIDSGKLKVGLRKPDSFYDGFKSKSKITRRTP